jgi:hypothetical protein
MSFLPPYSFRISLFVSIDAQTGSYTGLSVPISGELKARKGYERMRFYARLCPYMPFPNLLSLSYGAMIPRLST